MNAKIVVLYPHPVDSGLFEQRYVAEHLPLMRRLLGPRVALPTFRTLSTPGRPAPFYRMAEIHFDTLAQLQKFAASEDSQIGRASSQHVSTGGAPLVFVCQAQPDI
jgi:uncharacterized protein (TIGR02118 family)